MNHATKIEICNENKCKAGRYVILALSALYTYLVRLWGERHTKNKKNPRKNLKQYQVWSQNYPLLPRNLDDDEAELGRDQINQDLQPEQ